MVYTLRFFSLQNADCFIILTYLVPVLFTFYIQGVLKLKNNSGARGLIKRPLRSNIYISLPSNFSVTIYISILPSQHEFPSLTHSLTTSLQTMLASKVNLTLMKYTVEKISCQVMPKTNEISCIRYAEELWCPTTHFTHTTSYLFM